MTTKTVALVCRNGEDFSDEIIFQSEIMPMSKTFAERFCKKNGIKIISKRDNFGYPAMHTRENVTWLCSYNTKFFEHLR